MVLRIRDKVEFVTTRVEFGDQIGYDEVNRIHFLTGEVDCYHELEKGEVHLWDHYLLDHGAVTIVDAIKKEKLSLTVDPKGSRATPEMATYYTYIVQKEIDLAEYNRQKTYLGSCSSETDRQAYNNTLLTIQTLLAINHLDRFVPPEQRYGNVVAYKAYGDQVVVTLAAPHNNPVPFAILPFMRRPIVERLKRDMKPQD
jgi:hypothetical protein